MIHVAVWFSGNNDSWWGEKKKKRKQRGGAVLIVFGATLVQNYAREKRGSPWGGGQLDNFRRRVLAEDVRGDRHYRVWERQKKSKERKTAIEVEHSGKVAEGN